jgi:hypothetical protein
LALRFFLSENRPSSRKSPATFTAGARKEKHMTKQTTLVQQDQTGDRDTTVPQQPEVAHGQEYRAPRMFRLGTATDLVRRNISGHLIDGTGGWWVWGS